MFVKRTHGTEVPPSGDPSASLQAALKAALRCDGVELRIDLAVLRHLVDVRLRARTRARAWARARASAIGPGLG